MTARSVIADVLVGLALSSGLIWLLAMRPRNHPLVGREAAVASALPGPISSADETLASSRRMSEAEHGLLDALHAAVPDVGIRGLLVRRVAGMGAALIAIEAVQGADGKVDGSALQAQAEKALRAAFRALPDLIEVDLVAEVLLKDVRGFTQYHTCLTVTVPRERLPNASEAAADPLAILRRAGAIYRSHLVTSPPEGWAEEPNQPVLRDYLAEARAGTLGSSARRTPLASAEIPYGRAPAEMVREAESEAEKGQRIPVLMRGNAALFRVALTFDDGPKPVYTPLLLELLRRQGVRATFFVQGARVAHYPELARRIVKEGHEVAVHGYTHTRLAEMSYENAYAEMAGTMAVLHQVTGQIPLYYRPPGGSGMDAVRMQIARLCGLTLGLWTTNTGDWAEISPEVFTTRALSHLQAGTVLLMHEGSDVTLETLPHLLDVLRGLGYQPTSLSAAAEGELPRWMSPVQVTEALDVSAGGAKGERWVRGR